ncbi:hypothetical protein NM688_g5407 [Phlebia brevispora]|uniref:Uncharacterized protein n=1 Tax=Phlebia brevispora TaxID=194682 RepID=A0ACC1SVX2_9APHY|nr:hypothetical protein NM688_g5407 [Phlebia brevispora]
MYEEEETKPLSQPLPPPEGKPKITIVFQHESQTVSVKVSRTTLFGKIFKTVEERFNTQAGAFRFNYEGDRILGEQTPAEIGIEDGDVIDANLQQVGGFSS